MNEHKYEVLEGLAEEYLSIQCDIVFGDCSVDSDELLMMKARRDALIKDLRELMIKWNSLTDEAAYELSEKWKELQ